MSRLQRIFARRRIYDDLSGLREASLLMALGLFVGLVCAFAAAALMRRLLFNVNSWEHPTLSGVSVTLAAAALFASYLRARTRRAGASRRGPPPGMSPSAMKGNE